MTNVEVLEEMGGNFLKYIRYRLGAENSEDTSCDDIINKMTPKEVASAWGAWQLGYESWGEDIIDLYEKINKCSEK